MSELIVEVSEISNVEKHPNADKLDLVTVKGWPCIVGRGNHKAGDLVIYCPPDSVIPEKIIDQYNLVYLKNNGRVGTVKLRGYISQGLILDLPKNNKFKLGQDVAKQMGITKYEQPQASYQNQKARESIKGLFSKLIKGEITLRRFMFKSIGIIKDSLRPRKNKNPLFHMYTDINNIKHYNNLFTEVDKVVITEKIHGTNFRAGTLPIAKGKNLFDNIQYWIKKNIKKQKHEFVYGSHEVQLTGHRGKNCFYGEDVYGQIAERYNLAEIIPPGYILYGEIYGKGIQKGYGYGLKDSIDVVFFDLKCGGEYVDYWNFELFCKGRNLPTAPLLYNGNFCPKLMDNLIGGNSELWFPQKIREGCVIKMYTEENHPRLGRKILKCLNQEYLLIKNRTDYH